MIGKERAQIIMSGYFDTVRRTSSGGSVRLGNNSKMNNRNDTTTNSINDANNTAAATILLQQLAAALQQQHHGATQNENMNIDVTRMTTMLSKMTTENNNIQQDNDSSIATAAASNNNSNRPFQKFFQAADAMSKSSYGYRQHENQHKQTEPSINPKSKNNIITEKQEQWYTEERALIRELIVLTMRHCNGNILRFVPSENLQLTLWNTHGHPIGNRYGPNILAEGTVKIHPRVIVVPEWTSNSVVEDHNDDSFVAGGAVVKEDIEFKSNLPTQLLGSGAHDAISLCGECGFLYSRVASYIRMVLEEDVDGVQCATSRALASRLDEELACYYEELSLLEGELAPPDQEQAGSDGANPRYLTLRSLTSRLIPIRNHLRTLAILSDGVGTSNLRGGKLLSAVLRHSLDGHTCHSNLIRSIAADCAVPWYKLLSQWMAQGVLDDVHSEFFVKEVKPEQYAMGRKGKGMASSSSSAYYTWHQRYVLVEGQIPLCSCGGLMDIITVDLAKEVLLVGKGINFIRYCLLDKDWEVAEEHHQTQEEQEDDDEEKNNDLQLLSNNEGYNFATLMDVGTNDDELKCVSTLHDAVMKSSARIHSHILKSLANEHHMMQHLLALKHFLFLGQGDFVSSFVECLNQEFRGRTSTAGIYAHTLSSLLEGSLRTTTARFLPNFVLGNLRARLMMVDKNDANRYYIGPTPSKNNANEDEMIPWKDDEASIQDPWDYIYLDYKINSPLDAIVHASAMETYHQVFLFLFRLKRVEWMLNNSWRQSTALNHAILIETKAGGADAPAISEAAEHSSFLLRRISSTRQTMLHFISNLQNYLMFEVLEGGWEVLVQSLSKARSLDDVIRAHDLYLNEIMDKTLLSNNEHTSNGTSVESLLRRLLSIALTFGKFQDHIFSNSLAGLDKAAKIRRKVEERAEKGDWGRTTLDKDEGKVFLYLANAELFEFVEKTANDFDIALSDLLKTMSKQIDEVDCTTASLDVEDQDEMGDLVIKKNHDALPFLLFRLDFSGYYNRKAREMRKMKQSS